MWFLKHFFGTYDNNKKKPHSRRVYNELLSGRQITTIKKLWKLKQKLKWTQSTVDKT